MQPLRGRGTEDACAVAAYIHNATLAEYIAQTLRTGKFPTAQQIVQLFTAISSALDYVQ